MELYVSESVKENNCVKFYINKKSVLRNENVNFKRL